MDGGLDEWKSIFKDFDEVNSLSGVLNGTCGFLRLSVDEPGWEDSCSWYIKDGEGWSWFGDSESRFGELIMWLLPSFSIVFDDIPSESDNFEVWSFLVVLEFCSVDFELWFGDCESKCSDFDDSLSNFGDGVFVFPLRSKLIEGFERTLSDSWFGLLAGVGERGYGAEDGGGWVGDKGCVCGSPMADSII